MQAYQLGTTSLHRKENLMVLLDFLRSLMERLVQTMSYVLHTYGELLTEAALVLGLTLLVSM